MISNHQSIAFSAAFIFEQKHKKTPKKLAMKCLLPSIILNKCSANNRGIAIALFQPQNQHSIYKFQIH
jgi:hypothetical protein